MSWVRFPHPAPTFCAARSNSRARASRASPRMGYGRHNPPHRAGRRRAARRPPPARRWPTRPYAFGSSYEDESRRSGDEWAERARGRAEGNREATFFAYLGDVPVGIVGGIVGGGAAAADLVSMWVAPEARRHGVARGLIHTVVDWAREAGYGELQLWVTEIERRRPRALRNVRFRRHDRRPMPAVGSDPDASGE